MAYEDFADETNALYFCRFKLPIDESTDVDYYRHMANLGTAVKAAASHDDRLACVIMLDSDYPAPHAGLRKELASFISQPNFDPIVAFVTSKMAIRGVLTALRWIRQPTHEEGVFATAAEAFAWLEKHRQIPMGNSAERILHDLNAIQLAG